MPDPAASPVRTKAMAARAAAHVLQAASDGVRQDAVRRIADVLQRERLRIETANRADLEQARADGLGKPLADRLKLDGVKLDQLLQGVEQVADLPDPLGRTLRATMLDDGLDLYQVTVPLGVVGVVFESRPDAFVQIAALAVRSGNAALLKGGREAEGTLRVLEVLVREAVAAAGLPADAVQRLEGRLEVAGLLQQDDLVDLVVPRGSSEFVRHVKEHTRIPVLGHAEGICHVYVDRAADLDKALDIVIDAKTDYPAACNAAETLLVHRDIADTFLPRLRARAQEAGIRLIEEDPASFGVEFGDLRLAVHTVDSLETAVAHIHRHGSAHTDAIVTEDRVAARDFVSLVDGASVMVNASTRFADGFRYGLGAELGISTSRIHARGPVGVEGLTTTKWVLVGSGQRAGTYQGPQARSFRHTPASRPFEEAL